MKGRTTRQPENKEQRTTALRTYERRGDRRGVHFVAANLNLLNRATPQLELITRGEAAAVAGRIYYRAERCVGERRCVVSRARVGGDDCADRSRALPVSGI